MITVTTEQITSTNPAARAIISGAAPPPMRLAAARGMLPLPQNDLLEVLAFLTREPDAELAAAARESLSGQETETLFNVVSANEAAPSVLAFLAEQPDLDRRLAEAVLINADTPDEAVAHFARNAIDGDLLELVIVNQQRLIRAPAILDALLDNPHRTPDAERRAKEIRREFFEKSRGAEQIAAELRAQGNQAAAEFLEQAEFVEDLTHAPSEDGLSLEDAILLASHIEVPDDEVDDSWLALELIEDIYEETEAQRRALAEKIISESALDGDAAPERLALIRRVMMMPIKDRVKLAMKGDREARSILIRDSNRIVAKAVLANARITEQEVEKIAAMRTVPDEVLRMIGNSRTWARNYLIIHNLVRNPRTPLATAMTLMPRIQTKDLQAISNNRNVSEGIRKHAFRLLSGRR